MAELPRDMIFHYYSEDGNTIKIDATELIRCRDCKHKNIENAVWTCPFGLPGGPDFFCLYGTREDGEEG